jgi:hypothetical protein
MHSFKKINKYTTKPTESGEMKKANGMSLEVCFIIFLRQLENMSTLITQKDISFPKASDTLLSSPSTADVKVKVIMDVFIFLQGISFLNCSLTQEGDS